MLGVANAQPNVLGLLQVAASWSSGTHGCLRRPVVDQMGLDGSFSFASGLIVYYGMAYWHKRCMRQCAPNLLALTMQAFK